MTGPEGVWFGVGFDAVSMSNSPYAVVVDDKGGVTEDVLGSHLVGIQIKTSVKVVSNTVDKGARTVVLSRDLQGATPQHWSQL